MATADGKLEIQIRHNAFLTSEQEIWLRAYCASLINNTHGARHLEAKNDADRCLSNFNERFKDEVE